MKCHIMSRSLVNTHKKKCTWLSLFTIARFGNTQFTSVRRQMTSLSVHYKKYAFLFVLYWVIIYWDRGKYQPLLPTPRWLIVLEYTTQDGKKSAKTYFVCGSYVTWIMIDIWRRSEVNYTCVITSELVVANRRAPKHWSIHFVVWLNIYKYIYLCSLKLMTWTDVGSTSQIGNLSQSRHYVIWLNSVYLRACILKIIGVIFEFSPFFFVFIEYTNKNTYLYLHIIN